MEKTQTRWSHFDLKPFKELGQEPIYRLPLQERGKAKFENILNAAHQLIEERGVNQFSLTDVGETAGVATGSVYHFFPSMESIHVALVTRYDKEFAAVISKPIAAEKISSWHDILEIHFERSREYINENPPVLTLLIGPGRTWLTKQADTVNDIGIANAMVASISQFFELPSLPPPIGLVHFGIRILEGLWELSVQQHGVITAEFSEETNRAVYAYLRSYWPEHLPTKK